jgi:hypothetical protein
MEKRNNDDDGNMTEMTDDWLLAFFKDSEKGLKEPEIKTQQQIYSYPDGNVYMGHMAVDNEMMVCDEEAAAVHTTATAMTYKRHGSGTLRTPAFVYGIQLKNYTSDEAAENAHLAKWHEYIGTWKNDKLHGYGVHLQKSGNGGEIVIFEGIWENGIPKKSVHSKNYDGDYDFDECVFGW